MATKKKVLASKSNSKLPASVTGADLQRSHTQVQCKSCGYDVPPGEPIPRQCPKCQGLTWDKNTISNYALEHPKVDRLPQGKTPKGQKNKG